LQWLSEYWTTMRSTAGCCYYNNRVLADPRHSKRAVELCSIASGEYMDVVALVALICFNAGKIWLVNEAGTSVAQRNL
jgi:hypothetical protein